jgi:hypothetical protein
MVCSFSKDQIELCLSSFTLLPLQDCGREYLYKTVNRHHRELQPVESPYDTEIVPMTDYAAITQPKKESILDKEDRHIYL